LTVANNQLEGTYLAILNRLSNQQAPVPEPVMMEEEPMVVEDADEEAVEAEEIVEEARDDEQQQPQEYEPYQLTRYYRDQLVQFQDDYVRWEENQYHLRRQHFEETMVEQYKRALLLAQEQHVPQRRQREDIIINIDDLHRREDNVIINYDDAAVEVVEDENPEEFRRQRRQQQRNIIIDDNREDNIIIENDHGNNGEHIIIIENVFEEEEADDSDSDEEDVEQITEKEALIRYALTLDVTGTAEANNRPKRDGGGNITINRKKQLDSEARMLIVMYACALMGYKDPINTKAAKDRIALAASTLVCYDLGYRKVTGKSRLDIWLKEIEESARNHGGGIRKRHRGTIGGSYVDRINAIDPTYLTTLFRWACGVLGNTATFQQLATAMNAKAAAEHVIPDMHLSVDQLKRWFKKMKGKELKISSKPYLTEEHKASRLRYCERIQQLIQESKIITYLDEKWFYTDSRRKKMKYLPRQPFEAEGSDRLHARKVISRRHGLKTMFIGVVGNPNEEQGFNGKIFLERIAEEKILARATYRNNFSNDRDINNSIKAGEWRHLFPDDPTLITSEFLRLIVEFFGLMEEVEPNLCLQYETFVRGNKQKKTLGEAEPILQNNNVTDEHGNNRPLTIDDLELSIRLPAGTAVTEDISCDSNYMLDVMPRIGAAIRQNYPWIPRDKTIYLVMDNAGGHGTEQAIRQYTTDLLERFNIEIIQQAARSPETNALDLGLWRSIQSSAEQIHNYRATFADALALSVNEAWENLLTLDTITSVFNRIPIVLDLIMEDNGGNDRVEERRGRRRRAAGGGNENIE
jgi:hypothetical protein